MDSKKQLSTLIIYSQNYQRNVKYTQRKVSNQILLLPKQVCLLIVK